MPLPGRKKLLSTLRRELEYLELGGYRNRDAWRLPMIFEDSPICMRLGNASCLENCCPLMDFVPREARERQTPCRHIQLNEKGETVESYYRTGTPDELEAAVRQWLLQKIKELEN
jgi:hypothetical protein